jgi:hypothetical protein
LDQEKTGNPDWEDRQKNLFFFTKKFLPHLEAVYV